MQYCKRCLFPDTKPDIFFDDEGICDACRSAEKKHGVVDSIDWNKREKLFIKTIDGFRSKKGYYDCIIPVSGGKDSFFQTYSMKIKHKMKPLTVTFDQFDNKEVGKHNLDILKGIGVDHIHFTMNPNVVKKLVRKGFEIVGDPHWVNHVGIFTIPMRIAVQYNIPLIIYGENPNLEYGGPAIDRERQVLDKRWRQEFSGMRGFREEDMIDDEISKSDLECLYYPTDKEIKKVGLTCLFYGYFYKWDSEKNMKLAEKHGWKHTEKPWAGSWLDWENCDMSFLSIREHLKWIKYGYGRATDQVNIYIRSGRLTREEGVKIVRERDGKIEFKKEFCEYIGISEAKFDKIRDTFVNTDIFEKKDGKWVLKNPPS